MPQPKTTSQPPFTPSFTGIGESGSELLARVQMEIQAQHGRLKFASGDLAANVRRYRGWFGLPEVSPLAGRVFTQFDRTQAIGAGQPLEIALASAEEQKARAAATTESAARAAESIAQNIIASFR